MTDEERFRGEDGRQGFDLLTERGLLWSLESHCKPSRAAAWERGRKAERIEIRHPNCFTAALRLFDAVRESDMGVASSHGNEWQQPTLMGAGA